MQSKQLPEQVKLASPLFPLPGWLWAVGKPGAGGNAPRRSLLRARDESLHPTFTRMVSFVDLGSLATEGSTKELLGFEQLWL